MAETQENPGGIPVIESRLHWNNSSNVLCNYKSKQKYLDQILQNRALIPRYLMEPVDYLSLGKLKKICFPMICFCDIPFSKVATHMSHYGEYGIGLDKEAVLRRYRVQPIHYINEKSPLADDFRTAFLSFYNNEKRVDESVKVLLDYLLSTLVYMKPIWGQEKNKEGNLEDYVYQDECEWRYIPSDNFPDELKPIILPQSKTSEHTKNAYSDALLLHPECWLSFEWEDVRYIMVPDDKAARDTISTIESLDLTGSEKHVLMAKIEISRRFSDNM